MLPKNAEDRLLGVISILVKGTQICTSSHVQKEQKPDDMFGEDKDTEAAGLTFIHKTEVKETVSEEPAEVPVEEKKPAKPKKPKREGPGIFKKAFKKLSEISKSIVEDD
jgi:cell division septation protein DedD